MLKRWIIAGSLLLLAASLLLPPLAADTHYLLLSELGSVTINPLEGWQMVFGDNRVRQFYLLYTAVTALLLLWVLFCNNYLNYRSNMQQITPDIITPCAAGQGQFGTARWMKHSETSQFFGAWKIAKRQEWFRQLIAAGKASYKEVGNSNVRID